MKRANIFSFKVISLKFRKSPFYAKYLFKIIFGQKINCYPISEIFAARQIHNLYLSTDLKHFCCTFYDQIRA